MFANKIKGVKIQHPVLFLGDSRLNHHVAAQWGLDVVVAVPSSYNPVTEQALQEQGINIVIYANPLLRSAYPAMMATAQSILTHQRSAECDERMLSIKDILELIPGTK